MPELTIDAFERDGGKFKQGEEKMEEEIVQQVESVVVDEPRYHLIPKMPKSIAKAINDVMKDIKTLQKNSENKFQNYNYVDIDSFLKAVNPLCAQHGLIITMDEESCRVSKNPDGKPWLHIVYKFILSSSVGETWSYTPKRNMFVAMTGGQTMGSAQSYVLKQYLRGLLFISTGDKDDLDGHNQTFATKPKTGEGNSSTDSKHTTNRRKS